MIQNYIEDKDINYCIVDINGRFPKEKWAINRKCKEMAHILSGSGILVVEGKEYQLKQDDVVLIDINEKSFTANTRNAELTGSIPFFVVSSGLFFAQAKYYTKRDNLQNYLLIVTINGLGEITYKGKTKQLRRATAVVIEGAVIQSPRHRPRQGRIWQHHPLWHHPRLL